MIYNLPVLSPDQYQLVYYAFIGTAIFMALCLAFFLVSSTRVLERYRPAIFMVSFIVAASAAHYGYFVFRWANIYALQGDVYRPTANFMQTLFRYGYWTPTVPLLLIAFISVLDLPAKLTKSLSIRLSVATVAMIFLGYPGEIADDLITRLVWGTLSTLPFIYILYVLWVELTVSLGSLSASVKRLVSVSRVLMLFSWGFFPLIYLLPVLNLTGAAPEVGSQIGYAVADWIAKGVFSIIVFAIARIQTLAQTEPVSAEAPLAFGD